MHVVDINPDMISAGKKRRDIKAYSNQLDWTVASAEDIPLKTGTAERVTISFGLRNVTNRDMALREAFRVLKPGGQLVMCDAGKANYLHGLTGRIWMSTVVQWMARWVTKTKDHPWKGLARSYTHYGTNKYYRKMMKDVGFQDVSGRLLYPFMMSSRFRGRKPQ